MIIGPSYTLQTDRAAIQRSINYMLRLVEPGNEKGPAFLEQVPGLRLFASLGAEIRGAWRAGSRLFVVAGSTLYEVSAAGIGTSAGTLSTSTGPVDFAQGLLHLVIVDGPNGYAMPLSGGTLARITDGDFYGSKRAAFLDGKFIFVRPETQQFYWSSDIDTATSYDSLDFSSAESAPDNIIGHVVDHRELWLFGAEYTEVWNSSPVGEQPYQRNNGASIEVGCIAAHSIQKVDNSIYWLAQDRNGAGLVMMAGGQSGYQGMRVSTFAVEQALGATSDMTAARAFVMQQGGQTFYCLTAPDVPTTWVYDVSSRQWHERAEWIAGALAPWRATCHVYAHGMNIVGDAAGKLYELDPTKNTNDGAVLYRERTSPHSATPARTRVFFDRLRLDVTVGESGAGTEQVIEMQYSNDGGKTWGAWAQRALGPVGHYTRQVKWDRLGSARDRVWRIRCTDDAKAAIIGAAVSATEGAA